MCYCQRKKFSFSACVPGRAPRVISLLLLSSYCLTTLSFSPPLHESRPCFLFPRCHRCHSLFSRNLSRPQTHRNTWISVFPHLPQKNTQCVSGQEDVARVWQQPETDKRLNPNPADRFHANHLSLLCNGAKMMDDRVPPPLNQGVKEVRRRCAHTH